ncbi:MAG: GntR family transcriptional regulator [Candidatus Aminicenantes bacterium]|nr:GntR family transcriptional regulator [Candidatus Aminicenantes bacterium]
MYQLVFKKSKSVPLTATISDVIYQDMKEAILKRKLRPNQRIRIREIARFLGVSQSPVRDAIQRLSAEKFVSVAARSEVKVVDVGVDEGRKIIEFIRILDTGCIEKVIETISEKALGELKDMTRKLGELYKSKDIERYLEKNQRIHERIWRVCGNDFIYNTLVQAMERMQMVESRYISYFTDQKYLKLSWEDHRSLIVSIEKKDVAKAKKILSLHWKYR